MQIRRWFVGAIVGTLVVLVLAPVAAQAAAEPPEVTSIAPHNLGSAGGLKIIIQGRNFEEVTAVHFGTVVRQDHHHGHTDQGPVQGQVDHGNRMHRAVPRMRPISRDRHHPGRYERRNTRQ